MFVYYYWQYLYSHRVFFSYENGTTGIKNLDFSGFLESESIIIPPVEQVLKFNEYCKAVFDSGICQWKTDRATCRNKGYLATKTYV